MLRLAAATALLLVPACSLTSSLDELKAPPTSTGGAAASDASAGYGGMPVTGGASWSGGGAGSGGTSGSTAGGGTSPSGGSSGSDACVPVGCPANLECGVAPDGCGKNVPCGVCPTGHVCTSTQRCASPEEGSYDQPGYTCNGNDNKDPALSYSAVFGPNGKFEWTRKDADCKGTLNGTYSLGPPNKMTTHWSSSTCVPEGCLGGSTGDGGLGDICTSSSVNMTYYWTYSLTPTTLDLQQEPPYTSCSVSGIHFSFVRTGGP